jgi:hypothetical protein
MMKPKETFSASALAMFICIMGAVVATAAVYLLMIIVGSTWTHDQTSIKALSFLSCGTSIIVGAWVFVLILRKVRSL